MRRSWVPATVARLSEARSDTHNISASAKKELAIASVSGSWPAYRRYFLSQCEIVQA